ncbi:MAG: anthranilate phosphoribosyltransferase [bacterium]
MTAVQRALQSIANHHDLQSEEMVRSMREIMGGEATDAQIGAFIMGLHIKGETIDEIAAAAKVMRALATRIDIEKTILVDTCGTGGDSSGTFNISTAAAFVAAAGGVTIAKHGNRSVSSTTGSADVLEAAGVSLSLTADQVKHCIQKLNIGFLFAPAHHNAMKHAIGPRKELGIRTFFNVLGPLTNPAGAQRQVLGVYSEKWLVPLAKVLKKLGSEHVMVVNAIDGLDEITLNGSTRIAELHNQEIISYSIQPEDFNIQTQSLDSLKVESAKHSLEIIKSALSGTAGAATDIIALNAGAALYVGGKGVDLKHGIELAQSIISSGKALEKLEQLVLLSQELEKEKP